MIILNTADCGRKYELSVREAHYTAYANSEQEAADIVANYLESHNLSHLYYDNHTVRVLAAFSEYHLPDKYAKANGLTCCGAHKNYVRFLRIAEI